MTNIEYIKRQKRLIHRLRQRPMTMEEILDLYAVLVNKKPVVRTVRRDFDDIFILYNIKIKYDPKIQAYKIDNNKNSPETRRVMEAMDITYLLIDNESLTPNIQFEQRRPQGTELFEDLCEAIKKRHVVEFEHQKFWDSNSTIRSVEPYGLKESKNRWYLLAKDLKDNRTKTFGLDRINNLFETQRNFSLPHNFSLEKHFEYCFGISNDDEDEPQTVVLQFDAVQGKYIKSLPLHHTQQIISDTSAGLQISLCVYISEDFVMELLSHGPRVKVLEPQCLIDSLTDAYTKALERYK